MQSIIIKKGEESFHVYVSNEKQSLGSQEPFVFFCVCKSLVDAKTVTKNLKQYFNVETVLAHNEYIVQENSK